MRRFFEQNTPDYQSHCKQTSRDYRNETVHAKICAYILFAKVIWKDSAWPAWPADFLKKCFHWKKENEIFGIHITLPDKSNESE